MNPTDTRRRLIRQLVHGIDLDEQQYDAEHRAYMRGLLVRLALDVGITPRELGQLPTTSSAEPKASVVSGYPFESFIGAARAFEKEIDAAGCPAGSAANIVLAVAAGVALANQPQFRGSLINNLWPKVLTALKESDRG